MRRLPLLLSLACVSAACDKPAGTTAAASATAAVSSPPAIASTTAASASAPPTAKAPPTSVAAQHILIAYAGAKDAPKGTTRTKADARTRAEEALAKAKGGADFTELVKTYSDDPGSKERMGSVGKFTREKMAKPFADAAFALEVDEVSPVVETPFGFHVIKRNQ